MQQHGVKPNSSFSKIGAMPCITAPCISSSRPLNAGSLPSALPYCQAWRAHGVRWAFDVYKCGHLPLSEENARRKRAVLLVRASADDAAAGNEKKKSRKKPETTGSTRRKTSKSGESSKAKKKSTASKEMQETSSSGHTVDQTEISSKQIQDEPLSSSSLESEQTAPETRRGLVVKDETLWKKPFPWLGREFEETFVRPRNEPNPLVCCFGAAINEFIPTVRVCIKQMDPDVYSTWKGLQWTPPEFARSPGTTAANVAISVARLGGKPAFIGKVGDDDFGKQLVDTLQENKVETKGVKIDSALPTSLSRMELIRGGKRKISMTCVQQSAENSLEISDLDVDIIKEARLFHFSSISLTTETMCSTLMSAIETARSAGSVIFFDVNLPLPFWISRDATWATLEKAWKSSDVIKLTIVELEYLIEDEGLAVRTLSSNTVARSWEEFEARQQMRYEYHYTLEQIAPIWTDNIKILLVTDGTCRMHYYTPKFHGDVMGTEDVIVAAFSCDRTGSGDTISAAFIRKLTAQPEIFEDQDKLERALRFAVAAGVISQWTIGAVRGFPTESAAQNLTESMFPLTQI